MKRVYVNVHYDVMVPVAVEVDDKVTEEEIYEMALEEAENASQMDMVWDHTASDITDEEQIEG